MHFPIYNENSRKYLQENLWLYCLRIFEKVEYRRLCLILQNQYNLYIDDLLFISWYVLFSDDHESLLEIIMKGKGWHQEVILPLRKARYYLLEEQQVPISDRFATDIRSQELSSEKILLSFYQSQTQLILKQQKISDTVSDTKIISENYRNSLTEVYQRYWRYRYLDQRFPNILEEFIVANQELVFGGVGTQS